MFTDCSCATEASKTYEELFEKLDTNKDGKVDVAELKAGLTAMGMTLGKGAAQVNMHTCRHGRNSWACTPQKCQIRVQL